MALVLEAFSEANDVLLGDEIGGDQVADQANLYLVLEDHGVDALVDELHVLYRVGHCRVLHRRVQLDVEAVELDQPVKVPNAYFAIGRGGYEVGRAALNRGQRRDCLRVSLEDVHRF